LATHPRIFDFRFQIADFDPLEIRAKTSALELASGVLKTMAMQPSADLFGQSSFRSSPPSFWERILNDEQLDGCNPLEKLLAGCEIIAALDRVDLLLAA
jgi:hypothetical protein